MQGNRKTFRIILIYILTYGSRGLILPFINIYLIEQGFSGKEIGFIIGISAFIQLVSAPILNTIADRTAKHRRLLIGLIVTNSAAMVSVIVAPSKLWLGASVLVRHPSDRPVEPLLSQLTITWLTKQKQNIYGKFRAWGSFGWGVATITAGYIYALGGYPLMFAVSVVVNLAALPFTWALPEQTTEKKADDDKKVEIETKPVPRTFGFYILLVSSFLFFIGLNTSYAFTFVYFKESLGADAGMIGILAAVAALSEMPSMMIIDRLLRRIDIRLTYATGMFGISMLWIVYSSLTGAFFLIPLMVIRGTFYTFQNISRTLLVSDISDPANVATNQSLAFVSAPGLAMLLTSPIAGWIFDEYGARTMFRIMSVIGMLAALLIVVGWKYLETERRGNDDG